MPWVIREGRVVFTSTSNILITDVRATVQNTIQDSDGRLHIRDSYIQVNTQSVAEETSVYTSNNLKAVAEAKASGKFRVIKSKSGTLLIDLDSKAAFRRFKKLYKMLKEPFTLKKLDFYQSKSGEGWHVVLSTSATNFGNRIALQAILGSDPVKEAFSMINMKHGELEACYLFKPLPKKFTDV